MLMKKLQLVLSQRYLYGRRRCTDSKRFNTSLGSLQRLASEILNFVAIKNKIRKTKLCILGIQLAFHTRKIPFRHSQPTIGILSHAIRIPQHIQYRWLTTQPSLQNALALTRTIIMKFQMRRNSTCPTMQTKIGEVSASITRDAAITLLYYRFCKKDVLVHIQVSSHLCHPRAASHSNLNVNSTEVQQRKPFPNRDFWKS